MSSSLSSAGDLNQKISFVIFIKKVTPGRSEHNKGAGRGPLDFCKGQNITSLLLAGRV